MSETLLIDHDQATGVAFVTLNRPDVRNSLNKDLLTILRIRLAELAVDDAVRVVVLRGAGDTAFCSGMDLAEMSEPTDRTLLASAINELYAMGKPTIASVNGYALAGGMGLALSCDFVVASTNSTFGLPEINVGIWPYMISIPLLRSLPPKYVLGLMMTGRRVSVDELQRFGAIYQSVEANALADTVNDLAIELAKKPPEAMRLGRESYFNIVDANFEHNIESLATVLEHALQTDDAREGFAAFLEKRDPNWS